MEIPRRVNRGPTSDPFAVDAKEHVGVGVTELTCDVDGADRSRERDKLNLGFGHGFGHDLATELIAEGKNFAQSNTYLAERESANPTSVKVHDNPTHPSGRRY